MACAPPWLTPVKQPVVHRRPGLQSNAAMHATQDATHDADHRIDRRLTDLEVKSAFAEDLLDQLNLQVARQQQQIDLLLRELAQLRQQMPEPGSGGFRSLRDELPPHY